MCINNIGTLQVKSLDGDKYSTAFDEVIVTLPTRKENRFTEI